MKRFFEAKTIAVIGASRNKEKVGNIVFGNLIENPRLKIFPINPNADSILGHKAYGSVLDIPYNVEMAVIAIPAEFVPKAVGECGEKGIKNVVIISSGFSETGNEQVNDETREAAEKYGIKIIGPNVLGIINPYKNMNASFFRDMPDKGNVAFISQSGAVGTAVLDKALKKKLGFSGFISLGNMMNQNFIHALEYFAQDMYTEIILLYVESLGEGLGREFIDLCKEISKKKKIIAIKAGKSEKGKKAAETHTAALSSASEVYSGAFKQAGIIEVDSLEEMFRAAEIFSKYPKIGKRAGIITNAGGLGVLAVDVCSESGLEIPEIPDEVLKELDSFLPEGYSRNNPLDILGDALAERYEKVMKILGRRELFDFFVVIVSPQEMTEPLETAKVLMSLGRPVFPCFIGGKSFEFSKKFLEEQGMIYFEDVGDLGVLGKIC